MGWFPSHNLQGNLTLPFFPWTLLPLVDGVSPEWSLEVDDTGWCEREDHCSKIWGILGQFQRRWSLIQSLHGNQALWGLMEGFSSDVAFKAMVAWLPLCWIFFFFFFFPFFFFLATWLLVPILSPGEEEEGEEEATEEEGKGSTLGSNGGWFCPIGGVLDYREIMAFWTKKVENNHTGNPMVNLGMDNVAI